MKNPRNAWVEMSDVDEQDGLSGLLIARLDTGGSGFERNESMRDHIS